MKNKKAVRIVIIIIIAALVVGFVLSAVLTMSETDSQTEQANAELPNPWDEWNNLEEAEKAVGFELDLPEVVTDSYHADSFRTMNGELLEVIYHDDEYEVSVRKQRGEGQDISGDYSEYLEQRIDKRNGGTIEWFWGLPDNKTPYNPSKALISYDGFSWSLVAPNGYWGDSAEDFLLNIFKDL